MSAANASAWVMTLSSGARIAVAQRTLAEFVANPVTTQVPGAPAHAREVMTWRGRVLPVVDVDARLGTRRTATPTGVAIVGFVDAAGRNATGAIWITAQPLRVQVEARDGCELPAEAAALKPVAAACFAHHGLPIAVANLSAVFAAP